MPNRVIARLDWFYACAVFVCALVRSDELGKISEVLRFAFPAVVALMAVLALIWSRSIGKLVSTNIRGVVAIFAFGCLTVFGFYCASLLFGLLAAYMTNDWNSANPFSQMIDYTVVMSLPILVFGAVLVGISKMQTGKEEIVVLRSDA